MGNIETHIFFTPPFGAKCDGCLLIKEASLIAADKLIINCYAKTMPENEATMKVTGAFNSENNTQLGPTIQIDGTCQAK